MHFLAARSVPVSFDRSRCSMLCEEGAAGERAVASDARSGPMSPALPITFAVLQVLRSAYSWTMAIRPEVRDEILALSPEGRHELADEGL